MPRHPVHRSCPSIFVYFTDAASVQETAVFCGNQVGILDFTRLGSFSFAAFPRAKRGGKGIRTPGLLIANETLYQLSYTPISPAENRVAKKHQKNCLSTCFARLYIFTLALTRKRSATAGESEANQHRELSHKTCELLRRPAVGCIVWLGRL
jgi:hypothetical protein